MWALWLSNELAALVIPRSSRMSSWAADLLDRCAQRCGDLEIVDGAGGVGAVAVVQQQDDRSPELSALHVSLSLRGFPVSRAR